MDVMNFTDDMKTIQLSRKGSFTELRKHLNAGNQENLDIQDENGNTALILAALCGHVKCVEVLLQKGASADHQNKYGNTALILAALYGHVQCVEVLLQKEASVDHQNKYGNTALIATARGGHINIVRNLLCHKANIHLTNKGGTTAAEVTSTEEISEEIKNFQGRLTKGAR